MVVSAPVVAGGGCGGSGGGAPGTGGIVTGVSVVVWPSFWWQESMPGSRLRILPHILNLGNNTFSLFL